MSGRFAADGKAVCIATKGTAAQANEEAESRGSAPSAQAIAQEMAAALREDAVEGDDAGLSEEDQAAIRHDLAVAAGLDVEVSAGVAVEPEPITTQPEAEPEAPPASDSEEEEEEGHEAEVGGASGKRRTCSVRVTQSLDHEDKRRSQRARQLALGAQKRTASKATSRTASSAAQQAAQKKGKKKK